MYDGGSDFLLQTPGIPNGMKEFKKAVRTLGDTKIRPIGVVEVKDGPTLIGLQMGESEKKIGLVNKRSSNFENRSNLSIGDPKSSVLAKA